MNKREIKFYLKEKNKHIAFEPIRHTYTYNNVQFIPVSGLIEYYTPKFDEDGSILRKKALEEGITETELKKRWENKKNTSAEFGTKIHAYCERKLWNLEPEAMDQAHIDYGITIDKFFQDFEYDLIDTECMLYDQEHAVAGTADFLLYNEGKIAVCDWKTNAKDINNNDDSYGKTMLYELEHLKNTTKNHYSIQLSIYAYMLEAWEFNVDSLELFHIRKDKVDRIKLNYFKDEIIDIMKKIRD